MQVKPRQWTVLIYAAGANDLSSHIERRLDELVEQGPLDGVEVVVRQFDNHQVKDFVVGGPSHTRSQLNSGRASSLREFLAEGMKNYPAEHYLVVISSHGEGHAGVAIDTPHADRLDLAELQAGFPGRVDTVFFDACLMGSAEVAAQLEGRAGLVLASEDVVRSGCPLTLLAQTAAQSRDGAELAQRLVHSQHPDMTSSFRTLAALDTSAAARLRAPLSRLSQAILEATPETLDQIRQASLASRRAVQAQGNILMGYLEYPGPRIDLGDFARHLGQVPGFEQLGRGLSLAVDQMVPEFRAKPGDTATGVSLYLPQARDPEATLFGPEVELARATGWDKAAEHLAIADAEAAKGPSYADLLTQGLGRL
ncbi:MAG: clostripain-related cysteine peptidase [Vulcanimicrobiota bacterium]